MIHLNLEDWVNLDMERFKIENYLRDHPNGKFPEVTSLAKDAALRLADELKERMGFPQATGRSEMTQLIDKLGLAIDGIRAGQSGFSVRGALASEDIHPDDRVFVNWHQYDEIDQISLSDFDEYFEYIWYPSADDIDIFDSSFAWVLSVSHDGRLKVLRSDDASAQSGSPPRAGGGGQCVGPPEVA